MCREVDIQKVVIAALTLSPLVEWCARMNTGGARLPGAKGKPQFVRFGFPGMSDIIGQMASGEFLAIEVKRPGRYPTKEQRAFVARVKAAGGCAGVARSADDALQIVREWADERALRLRGPPPRE